MATNLQQNIINQVCIRYPYSFPCRYNLILICKAMEVQRERSLISGMDVSSNNDSMAELRAAFSDVRIESQPTMEVVKLFSQYCLFILKYFVPRLPPTCPTQNTCWRDPARRTIETKSSFLPCPVTLYTFSFRLRSIDLVKRI